MEQNNKKVWIWTGVIIALLALGTWMLMSSKNNDVTDTGVNSLSVSDQNADAVAVIIDSATLSTSGFIVIHEDVNGMHGATLGQSALLQADTHKNVTVIFPTAPGKTYWAMLHGDNGNGIFNENIDPALKDVNGKEVVKSFKMVKPNLIDGQPDIKG